jgi:hypothetical protein
VCGVKAPSRYTLPLSCALDAVRMLRVTRGATRETGVSQVGLRRGPPPVALLPCCSTPTSPGLLLVSNPRSLPTVRAEEQWVRVWVMLLPWVSHTHQRLVKACTRLWPEACKGGSVSHTRQKHGALVRVACPMVAAHAREWCAQRERTLKGNVASSAVSRYAVCAVKIGLWRAAALRLDRCPGGAL